MSINVENIKQLLSCRLADSKIIHNKNKEKIVNLTKEIRELESWNKILCVNIQNEASLLEIIILDEKSKVEFFDIHKRIRKFVNK